jgi:hypothetical protein
MNQANRMVVAAATAAMALAACGGGGDSGEAYVGTYTVTSHRWNLGQGTTISCSDAGAEVVGGDPFIALIVDPFFDDPAFIRLQQCSTPDTCTDELVTMSPGGPGLVEEGYNSQTAGGVTACGLYANRATAVLTGDAVRVEVRHWSVFNDLPESQCTVEAAQALIGTPDCREVEIWDATRLASPQ